VRAFESQFYRFLDTERPDVLPSLAQKLVLDDESVEVLRAATESFKDTFTA
jgi:hypothetical protein